LQTWQQNREAVATSFQGLVQEKLAEIRGLRGDATVPDAIVRGAEFFKAYIALRSLDGGQAAAPNVASQSRPEAPPEDTLPTENFDQPTDATAVLNAIPVALVTPVPVPQIPESTDNVDATAPKPIELPDAGVPSMSTPPVADPGIQRLLTGKLEPGEEHSESVTQQVRGDLWKARLLPQKSLAEEGASIRHNGAPAAVNYDCDAANSTVSLDTNVALADVATESPQGSAPINQGLKSAGDQPAAALDKSRILPTSFVSDPRPDQGRLQIQEKSHLANASGDSTTKVTSSAKVEVSVSRRDVAHSVRPIESALVTGTGLAKVEAIDAPEQKARNDSDSTPEIDTDAKPAVGDVTPLPEGSSIEVGHGQSVEANHLDRVPVRNLSEHVQAIVVRHLDHSDAERSTSVVLRLDPPSLGRVDVHVTQSGDTLSIRMVTSGEAARDMIERQMTELETSLTDRGVQFDKCQVECNSSGQHTFDRSFRQQSTQPEEANYLPRRVAAPDAVTRPWQGRTGLDYVA
jgi:flagellar hook-length control protein FliK